MSWSAGPTLKEQLGRVDVVDDLEAKPFRMVVQWVNHPDLDFRGYSVTIATGSNNSGDDIVVAKSGRVSRDEGHCYLR